MGDFDGAGMVRAWQLPQIALPHPEDPDYLARKQREEYRKANPPPPPPPTIKKLCQFCGENWTLWGLKPRDGSGLVPVCTRCAPDAVKKRRATVKRLAEGGGMPPTVSTTKARVDSAATAIRQRARSTEEKSIVTTPAPTPRSAPDDPTPAPEPVSLPQVPHHEWHDGDPPPIRRSAKKETGRVDWSMLLGIASTQPGRWMKRPGEPQHVKKINQLDGFEATCREGIVYLRAIAPEEWGGDEKAPT